MFTVSHKDLLLRSVKTEIHPTRIEILFKCVSKIHLLEMYGLESLVVEIVDNGKSNASPFDSIGEDTKLYRLTSSVNVNWIEALGAYAKISEKEYSDDSDFDVFLPLGVKSLGD